MGDIGTNNTGEMTRFLRSHQVAGVLSALTNNRHAGNTHPRTRRTTPLRDFRWRFCSKFNLR